MGEEAGEPVLGDLDKAPVLATPEELNDFKNKVITKVRSSRRRKVRKDPDTGVETRYAWWRPKHNTFVYVDIGAMQEPEAIKMLVELKLGHVQGIDTRIHKHYRYFPGVGVSEYDEELAEYYQNRRLIGEEAQRLLEKMPEITDAELEEEKKAMIEHAKNFGKDKYKGMDYPELTKDQIDEVEALLDTCSEFTEVEAPQFV